VVVEESNDVLGVLGDDFHTIIHVFDIIKTLRFLCFFTLRSPYTLTRIKFDLGDTLKNLPFREASLSLSDIFVSLHFLTSVDGMTKLESA
jgi:hypothetical protein